MPALILSGPGRESLKQGVRTSFTKTILGGGRWSSEDRERSEMDESRGGQDLRDAQLSRKRTWEKRGAALRLHDSAPW